MRTALYVSTDLRSWTTDEPDVYATDVHVDDATYRRLDLSYYAWLRHRVDQAMQACEAKRITLAAWETLCERFALVYAWALEAFGQDAMDQAEHETNVSKYVPPTVGRC